MNWALVLFIVIGAIPNVLKKQLLDKLTIPEYFISFSICMAFLTFSLFCYKTYVKKEKIQLSKVFNSSVFPIFAVLVILKFISIYYKLGFLKKMDVSKYTPIVKSLSIVATILLGVVFLGEKKTMKDLAGSALIIGGVIMLNGVNSRSSGSV
jgi:drug/metabolite transporter (DMT)-like permease